MALNLSCLRLTLTSRICVQGWIPTPCYGLSGREFHPTILNAPNWRTISPPLGPIHLIPESHSVYGCTWSVHSILWISAVNYHCGYVNLVCVIQIRLLFLIMPINRWLAFIICSLSVVFLLFRKLFGCDFYFCLDNTIMALPYFLLGYFCGQLEFFEKINNCFTCSF